VAPGSAVLEAPTLTQQYRQVREATLALCAPLATEDYVVQSMPDASPAKWHLAHTTWFFEEFVLQHAQDAYEFHDKDYRYLFNSYYNTVGPMHVRANRGLLSRPTLPQVLEYRARIDERMEGLLHNGTDTPPEIARVITLGLHHEQQHQELILTDIKHLFSCNPLLPAYAPGPGPTGSEPTYSTDPGAVTQHTLADASVTVPGASTQPAIHGRRSGRDSAPRPFRRFQGGLVEIGHEPSAGEPFCFDNELPRHRVYVGAFELATRPVTNAEYLDFIRDGGYGNPAHWLSDGWATIQREQWTRPIYWSRSLEEEFTLRGLVELDPRAPVCHLSHYEADAFARWADARLPTEFEWEVASMGIPLGGNFVESCNWHPTTATHSALALQADAATLLQMFGDVWEWTQSAYSPYPGYRPASGALGEYNGKFMVNQVVLRGGSCATPRSHIRPTYRNFFNPAARWQFSGVRLARDL
jgi:formylglycine-generating enzyme required for sulfatase activity